MYKHCKKNAGEEILKCRRKHAWVEHVAHIRKSWNCCTKTLSVKILKEYAIDSNGWMRQGENKAETKKDQARERLNKCEALWGND